MKVKDFVELLLTKDQDLYLNFLPAKEGGFFMVGADDSGPRFVLQLAKQPSIPDFDNPTDFGRISE